MLLNSRRLSGRNNKFIIVDDEKYIDNDVGLLPLNVLYTTP